MRIFRDFLVLSAWLLSGRLAMAPKDGEIVGTYKAVSFNLSSELHLFAGGKYQYIAKSYGCELPATIEISSEGGGQWSKKENQLQLTSYSKARGNNSSSPDGTYYIINSDGNYFLAGLREYEIYGQKKLFPIGTFRHE